MRSDYTMFKVRSIISDFPTSVVITDKEGHMQDKDIDKETIKNLSLLEKYRDDAKRKVAVYEQIEEAAFKYEKAIRAQYYLETGEHMGGYIKQGDYSFNRDQMIDAGRDFKRKIEFRENELRSLSTMFQVGYITNHKEARMKKRQSMEDYKKIEDAYFMMRKILETKK